MNWERLYYLNARRCLLYAFFLLRHDFILLSHIYSCWFAKLIAYSNLVGCGKNLLCSSLLQLWKGCQDIKHVLIILHELTMLGKQEKELENSQSPCAGIRIRQLEEWACIIFSAGCGIQQRFPAQDEGSTDVQYPTRRSVNNIFAWKKKKVLHQEFLCMVLERYVASSPVWQSWFPLCLKWTRSSEMSCNIFTICIRNLSDWGNSVAPSRWSVAQWLLLHIKLYFLHHAFIVLFDFGGWHLLPHREMSFKSLSTLYWNAEDILKPLHSNVRSEWPNTPLLYPGMNTSRPQVAFLTFFCTL